MSRKLWAAVVLPAVAALALTACSSQADHQDHNDADIAFAQQKLPHHRQAVEMAAPVPQHTRNAQVIALADGIAKAQQPELDQLTAWLKAWGAPEPAGHHSMPGMVDTGDLDTQRDAAYDRKWLTLMVDHHRGAIDMARTELAQGADAGAKAMAQRTADTQQAEVDRMTALLAA